MADQFNTFNSALDSPGKHAFAITPNDAADLAAATRAIYVGTSGDLAVIMVGGETVTFPAVQGGTMLPIRATRVLSTGTTASGLVGVW
jgi:hypothetical protein